MRGARLAVACALAVAASAQPGAAAPALDVPVLPDVPSLDAPAGVPLPVAARTKAVSGMVGRINGARRAHGLHALRESPSLLRSSRRFGSWLMRNDRFGHLPRIPVSRRFREAGETLAMHTGWRLRVGPTVQGWMSSTTHRAVLLSSRFRWIGVAHARGRMGSRASTVWVAQVGRR